MQLFTNILLAPLVFMGGVEAVAARGVIRGLALPAIGSLLGEKSIYETAKGFGASDTTAGVLGIVGGLAGGGLASLELTEPSLLRQGESLAPGIGGAAGDRVTRGVRSFNDEVGEAGRYNCSRCTAAFLEAVRTRGVAPGEFVSSQYPMLENRTIERINKYLEESLKITLGDSPMTHMPTKGFYVIHQDPYFLNKRFVSPHVMVGWNLGRGAVFYDPQIGKTVTPPLSFVGYKVSF